MKTAVVLFNLGGPDSLESVQPFLFNLFNDRAIIGLPQPLRFLIATLISNRRAPTARHIYEQMGGRSPIVPQTLAQTSALQTALGEGYKIFTCMRYWHPMADEVAKEVAAYQPDKVVLLPLYPQFSTTTTGSSAKDWGKAAARIQLNVPTHLVGCYFEHAGFAKAQAALLSAALQELDTSKPYRLLFSAHGLPEKIVADGDPYQWQVEQSVAAVMKQLSNVGNAEVVNCYQSRVGPLKWIGPSTDDEIKRAGKDGLPIVLVPIAFVSEHSETLVELDIEYRELAHEHGVPNYVRVPTVQAHPAFIDGLADLVRGASFDKLCCNANGTRACPTRFGKCPCQA